MKFGELMRELKLAGTAQNRKVYARHGVTRDMYGVSFAILGKLRKRIKMDQTLAEQLWATGNHDARILAAHILDAKGMKMSTFDAWAKECDNYVVADALSGPAATSPHARKLAEKWTKLGRKKEFAASAGWNIVCRLAMDEKGLHDSWFEERLKTIESAIHSSLNRVRYSMNNALIAIGARSPALERKAIAVARSIGKVEVDHGETGCRTPDAVTYIARMKAHNAKKKAVAAKKSAAQPKKAAAAKKTAVPPKKKAEAKKPVAPPKKKPAAKKPAARKSSAPLKRKS